MNNILLCWCMLFRQIKSFKVVFLSLLLCTGILLGCGSSGDGKGGNEIKSKEDTEEILPPIDSTGVDSTKGLKWDDTEWDQGEWG